MKKDNANSKERRKVRSIWISDVHLGTPGCQAEALADFLGRHDCEQLYLVGDIIDGWRLRQSFYWPQEHTNVVRKILTRSKRGAQVTYITGNHDEFLRKFVDYKLEIGNIRLVNEAIHTTADGRRLLVLHGDAFDIITRYHRWVALAGDAAYNGLMTASRYFNRARRLVGLPHFSLSAYAKRKKRLYIAAEPLADAELVLIFDDWGEYEDPDEDEERHGDGGSGGHGTEPPDPWVVTGLVEPSAALDSGSTVRLRLLNASNTAYLDLRWPGLRQIASDQGLLPQLAEPASIVLAPGDRAEAEVLLGAEAIPVETAPYSLAGGTTPGDDKVLLTLDPVGGAAAPAGLDWSWPGGEVSPDPAWTDLIYVFAGDPLTGEWLINGETYPDVTVQELPLGSEAIITVRNLSPTEHPFHLHGHSFEVLSEGGVPPARRTVEDTINVRIREDLRLRLIADNPGDWMTHCHILPHAHGGMMTVLRVLDE